MARLGDLGEKKLFSGFYTLGLGSKIVAFLYRHTSP